MKFVIDISKDDYQLIKDGRIPFSILDKVMNGTPLPKELELIIEADNVLDKTREEIDRQEKWLLQAGYTPFNVHIAFDDIKSVVKRK